jgi:negative regulator of genetic competence, sporulation and motility
MNRFMKGIDYMELIVINECKIKIMLSKPDMLHYQLETSQMNRTDEHTRAAFRHIFDDAREEIGFDITGRRLFIQMYTSKEGGCEIFVTKLDATDDKATPQDSFFEIDPSEDTPNAPAIIPKNLSEGEAMLLKKIYRITNMTETVDQADKTRCISLMNTQKITVEFNHLEALLTVCHRLLRDGYRDRSSAYKVDTDTGTIWYLTVYVPIFDNSSIPLQFSFLTEYGCVTSTKNLYMYLLEHGSCICEHDAVHILGVL